MTFEGPLLDGDMWPPVGTRRLLQGVEFDETGEVRLTKAPYEHIVEIVEAFAPRAFRPMTRASFRTSGGSCGRTGLCGP